MTMLRCSVSIITVIERACARFVLRTNRCNVSSTGGLYFDFWRTVTIMTTLYHIAEKLAQKLALNGKDHQKTCFEIGELALKLLT